MNILFRKPLLDRHVLDQLRKAKIERSLSKKKEGKPKADGAVQQPPTAADPSHKPQVVDQEQLNRRESQKNQKTKSSLFEKIRQKLLAS
ncbi:MAG: hypothetical protein GVY36_11105 [Verrucomicrobia bacterium]|nr:hypothetical protein [Verrucomicrobiota bacterium]